jgi:type IV pilus assembly protein PilM
MPSRTKHLVGLEIEPHGVTAAQVAVADGRLTVRRAAHLPLEPGAVRDGEVLDPEAVTAAIKALWKSAKGMPKRVRVGIANQKIVARIIELPQVADDKELEAAVTFRAQDEIPMPLDAAVLDWQALDVVETPEGKRQRVLLVAARRDMVERVLAVVRGAGLRCEGIDLSAFALVRALHRPDLDEGGPVLYLSVGGLTNLAVAEGTTCLFTRATGGGVDALALELAERRGITLDDARRVLEQTTVPRPEDDGPAPAPEPERAWVPPLAPEPPAAPPALSWGDAPTEPVPVPDLYRAPEPEPAWTPAEEEPPTQELVPGGDGDPVLAEAREVLAEGVRRIAAEVRTSLDFHAAQGAHGRVEKVVLTGPATALPGFADALSAQLTLEVEPVALAGAPAEAPHAAVAAGLAVAEAPA